MAGAGAGSGAPAGSYTVHPFFANGHGEQCDVRSPKLGQIVKARVDYVLPPGVHVVTVQEVGRYALLSSASALRASFRRGFDATRMVPKPSFNKSDDEGRWCRSDYMKFKHEIAKAFRVVYAYAQENPDEGDLFDFVVSEFAPNESERDYQSLDDLYRKGQQPKFKGYFNDLCSLYDARIHIRYPGETVADNVFTPVSYVTQDDMFVGVDAAAGLIDAEIFSTLDRETQVALTKDYTLSEVDAKPDLIPRLYSASVYPTKGEIDAFLRKSDTQRRISDVPDRTEPTDAGKTLVILNQDFKRSLSKLIPELVTKYEVTAETPIVLYYPMCRVFSEDPVTKGENEAIALARGMSLTAETQGRPSASSGGPMRRERGRIIGALMEQSGLPPLKKKGGKRKTYRKKKLRNQTRKRRQ
jgi:hypothetical protein